MYMVSYGVSYEPWIQKLDRENALVKKALTNVMHDWEEARIKENEAKKKSE